MHPSRPRPGRRLRSGACLVTVAAVAAGAGTARVASAGAAVPAQPVSSRSIDVTPTDFAYDALGRPLLAWRAVLGTPDATRTAFYLRGGAGWGTTVRLPSTVVAAAVTLTGPTAAGVALWRQEPVVRHRSRSVITVARTATGAVRLRGTLRLAAGPARPVTYEGPQPTLFSPRVAPLPGGGMLVAWGRGEPRADAGIWVATVRPDGTATTPRLLGAHGLEPILSVAADGTGLVGWRRGRRVLVRMRSATGHWGPVETAATGDPRQWDAIESVRVAGGARTFAVGTLETQRTGAGVWVRAVVHVRTPQTGWRHRTLSEFSFSPTGQTSYVTDRLRVLVVRTATGGLQAVWPALADGHVTAVTAAVDPGTAATGVGLGPTESLSPAGTDVALEDAAAAPFGGFAATWFDLSGGGGTPNLVEVSPLGDLTRTLGLASERALLGARVAYDPATGRPVVVWAEGTAPAGYHLVAAAR